MAVTWRHPLDAIADRPRRDAALAVGAAWLAFMCGLLFGGDVRDVTSFALGAAIGALLVFVGFAAASAVRTRSADAPHVARLALLSAAAGAVLGVANLAANWATAQANPILRSLLVERFARLEAFESVVIAPLVEEVVVRLFLMSVMAWLIFRVTKRRALAFGLALVGSALFFGMLHLFRPLPLDPVLANYYRAGLLVKYTLAGVPLGWIFWRWGLPYAMLCHAVVNAVHVALEGIVF